MHVHHCELIQKHGLLQEHYYNTNFYYCSHSHPTCSWYIEITIVLINNSVAICKQQYKKNFLVYNYYH